MSSIPLLITLLCLGQAPTESSANEASLKAMQQRVQDSRVKLTDQADIKLQLVTAPVFRDSDELRRIEDAGIWLWTNRGRPVAAMKVEYYKPGVHPRPWLYCFTSLSSELVTAERLTVRLQDSVVWQLPRSAGKGHSFDNWIYFVPKN